MYQLSLKLSLFLEGEGTGELARLRRAIASSDKAMKTIDEERKRIEEKIAELRASGYDEYVREQIKILENRSNRLFEDYQKYQRYRMEDSESLRNATLSQKIEDIPNIYHQNSGAVHATLGAAALAGGAYLLHRHLNNPETIRKNIQKLRDKLSDARAAKDFVNAQKIERKIKELEIKLRYKEMKR